MAPTTPPPPPQTSDPPRFELLNLPPDGTVYHRVFLLVGRVFTSRAPTAPDPHGPDGFVNVSVNGGSAQGGRGRFPDEKWELNDTWFKALVPLSPGENSVLLTVTGTGPGPSGSAAPQQPQHTLQLTFRPFPQRNKLHLAILCARDSPVWQHWTARAASGSAHNSHVAASNGTATSASAPAATPMPPSFHGGGRFSKMLKKAMDKVDVGISGHGSASSNTSAHAQANNGHVQVALAPPAAASSTAIDSPPGPRRDAIEATKSRALRRRLALQAYLWQSFHAEQLYRHGFGHRSFELAEHDDDGPAQSELADLPVVRMLCCDYTRAQLREADRAQQFKGAKEGGAMHSIAQKTIERTGTEWCHPGDAVAVLIADATWDASARLLRAHAAVGAFAGLDGSPSVGVMGSHWLWAAPERLSDVTHAFMDTEPTDEQYCVNDLGEGKTAALTLSIGTGAMLHEAGHALSNPHYPTGIMARGYVEYNRAFMTRETHSLHGHGHKPITPQNDSEKNHLHRCQAVRARLHPAFRLPHDPRPVHMSQQQHDSGLASASASTSSSVSAWLAAEPLWKPTSRGAEVSCGAGIALLEVEVGGKFKTHVEWLGTSPADGKAPPRTLLLTPQYVASLVGGGIDPLAPGAPEVKLTAVGCNLRTAEMDSFRRMAIARPVNVPGVDMARFGRQVRNGPRTKVDDDGKHEHYAFLLNSAWQGGPALVRVDVFAHHALLGLRFHYADGSSQLLGRAKSCRDPPGASLAVPRGEGLSRIEVRSGWWVDAAQVHLAPSGTHSAMVGGGGGGVRILAASGGGGSGEGAEEIVGLVGSSGDWVDSLGVLVADVRR